MTDLERVRRSLALFEGIAVPDWDTAKEMAAARVDLDAHLKEDAEREEQRNEALFVRGELVLENKRLRQDMDAAVILLNDEVTKLRAEELTAQEELAELREAVRALRADLSNIFEAAVDEPGQTVLSLQRCINFIGTLAARALDESRQLIEEKP